MKPSIRSAVDLRITSILVGSKAGGPPVDLFRIARTCRVLSLHFRNMIPKGGLESIDGGFRVYLRHTEDADYELSNATAPILSARQRFTFAHELAHTLFYDWNSERPRPLQSAPKGPELERACDHAASQFVIPTELLRPRLRQHDEFATADILKLADEFDVSAEAMLRGVALTGCSAINRAIILARKAGPTDAEVCASWFGTALLFFMARPANHQKLSGSHPDLAASLEAANGESWERRSRGRMIKFRRLQHPWTSNRFFIEAEASY